MRRPKVIVILGPTATGKSNCGIMLAHKLDGEIISGDSMLVYKHMDIATAKPAAQELSEIKHHLINVLEPSEKFNVVDFKERATTLIHDINARGHMPIIVGGTGLYIKALLENYDFAQAQAVGNLRVDLENYAIKEGNQALHQRLAQVDAKAAKKLHSNDRRRVIRAIETAMQGEEVSQKHAHASPYDVTVFGLHMPRELLYPRINKRVDSMVDAGIFEETKKLLAMGVPEDAQAMKSIGYRQILAYFHGEYDKNTCIDKIKQATRNFAKRQFTWYKKMPYIQWLEVGEPLTTEIYVAEMLRVLEQKRKLR
ncbi:MAG: tRNA (adenosine(37)-N6)-dimethylallyltransferase MiaA [Acidaminococcaceae bacterium]|nr:tRNA (adenosine(37)-N6)-dimethylallyltransferase MiaA [Acidaminococcaceae bacterium]